ncbi:hypothetical protein D3C87_1500100 [compost metagenome]
MALDALYQLKITLLSVDEALRIAVWPGFTVVDEACTCGNAGSGFTVTAAVARLALVQLPLAASTKYVVFAWSAGVVNTGPSNTGLPPVAAVYHL